MQIALLGGGLAILLTALVAYGQAFTMHAQNRGFLGWLAGQALDTAKAAVWITEQIVPLSSYILHELGHTFNVAYSTAARWFGGVENYVQMTGGAVYNLALSLNDWARWITHTYVPGLVHGITAPVVKVIHGATVRVTKIERTIVKIPSLTRAEIKALVAVAIPGIIARDIPYFDWLKKHLKTLERLVAGAAGAVIGANIPLVKDLLGIRRRLGKLEHLLTRKASMALVATALAGLGLSWIRCNNWRRLGRGVCGLPSSIISDILGLITDVFMLADICEVIKLTDDAFGVVEGPLASFVGNVGGALCHGDFPEQAWGGIAYRTAAPELSALAL